MSEAIVDVNDLTIYRTDGISTGGVRESVLVPLKSVKGELIRCKDCRWYKDWRNCHMEENGIDFDEDEYCSRAERKD